jgi:hypothetical protein
MAGARSLKEGAKVDLKLQCMHCDIMEIYQASWVVVQ